VWRRVEVAASFSLGPLFLHHRAPAPEEQRHRCGLIINRVKIPLIPEPAFDHHDAFACTTSDAARKGDGPRYELFEIPVDFSALIA
jgi:hypothetical protein